MADDNRSLSAKIDLVKIDLNRTWSEKELDQIKVRLEKSGELTERLRTVPLENSDRPGIRFVPFRSDTT